MKKETTTMKNTPSAPGPDKGKQTRKPKAVTLLVYLTDYLVDSNIPADESIAVVVANLEASIVAEAKAKMRS